MYKKVMCINTKIENCLEKNKSNYLLGKIMYTTITTLIGIHISLKKSERTKPQISHDKNVIFV